jgi:hypothetical protein
MRESTLLFFKLPVSRVRRAHLLFTAGVGNNRIGELRALVSIAFTGERER